MSHFAEIGGLSAFTLTTEITSNSGTEVVTLSGYRATVLRVIVADQNFINTGLVGPPQFWIQCSYTGKIRNIYPGIGCLYESIRDIFYFPSPFPSWIFEKKTVEGLDENNNIIVTSDKYDWVAPVPYPQDGQIYHWDETTLSWKSPS